MSVDEIVANHEQRHSHWKQQTERCPYCGSFLSLTDYGRTMKGLCPQCNKAVLKYAQD